MFTDNRQLFCHTERALARKGCAFLQTRGPSVAKATAKGEWRGTAEVSA